MAEMSEVPLETRSCDMWGLKLTEQSNSGFALGIKDPKLNGR